MNLRRFRTRFDDKAALLRGYKELPRGTSVKIQWAEHKAMVECICVCVCMRVHVSVCMYENVFVYVCACVYVEITTMYAFTAARWESFEAIKGYIIELQVSITNSSWIKTGTWRITRLRKFDTSTHCFWTLLKETIRSTMNSSCFVKALWWAYSRTLGKVRTTIFALNQPECLTLQLHRAVSSICAERRHRFRNQTGHLYTCYFNHPWNEKCLTSQFQLVSATEAASFQQGAELRRYWEQIAPWRKNIVKITGDYGYIYKGVALTFSAFVFFSWC